MTLRAENLQGAGQARRVRVRFAEMEQARPRLMAVERVNEVVSDAAVRMRVTGVLMLGFTAVVAVCSAL